MCWSEQHKHLSHSLHFILCTMISVYVLMSQNHMHSSLLIKTSSVTLFLTGSSISWSSNNLDLLWIIDDPYFFTWSLCLTSTWENPVRSVKQNVLQKKWKMKKKKIREHAFTSSDIYVLWSQLRTSNLIKISNKKVPLAILWRLFSEEHKIIKKFAKHCCLKSNYNRCMDKRWAQFDENLQRNRFAGVYAANDFAENDSIVVVTLLQFGKPDFTSPGSGSSNRPESGRRVYGSDQGIEAFCFEFAFQLD